MRASWVVMVGAVVATPSFADPAANAPAPTGLLCVFPQAKPLPECFKGSSISEQSVRDCEARNAKKKKVPPRIRVDGGPWVAFAPDRWRCVAAPVDKAFKFQVENYGKVYYSDRTRIPADCAGHRVDLTRANFYGSMWTKCSKRAADRDDVP